jgi:hypothetical protein
MNTVPCGRTRRRIAASSVAPIAPLSTPPASLRCTRLLHPHNEHHPGSASYSDDAYVWYCDSSIRTRRGFDPS